MSRLQNGAMSSSNDWSALEVQELDLLTLPRRRGRSRWRGQLINLCGAPVRHRVRTPCFALAGVIAAVLIVVLVSTTSRSSRGGRPAEATTGGDEKYELWNRPTFHIAPETGWMNDPNGPIWYDGLYHIFFQHNPAAPRWDFDIEWGHAVSEDLVRWKRLPSALKPSDSGPDCSGVWSGCIGVDDDGEPVLMYTGARQKHSTCRGPEPATKTELSSYETVMYAVPCRACSNNSSSEHGASRGGGVATTTSGWGNSSAAAGGTKLDIWKKKGVLIGNAGAGFAKETLAGWRDPFLFRTGEAAAPDRWLMLGTGLTDGGRRRGAVMLYHSEQLQAGWKYHGLLAEGTAADGFMWEVPLLIDLRRAPTSAGAASAAEQGTIRPQQQANFTHVLVVCAEGSQGRFNRRRAPVLYWAGRLDPETMRFNMHAGAKGPFLLDSGDATFYAPNAFVSTPDTQTVLWGWLRECTGGSQLYRCPEQQSFAGSLSLPRSLTLHPGSGTLVQQPVPGVLPPLHTRAAWSLKQLTLNRSSSALLRLPSPNALDAGLRFALLVETQVQPQAAGNATPSAASAPRSGLPPPPPPPPLSGLVLWRLPSSAVCTFSWRKRELAVRMYNTQALARALCQAADVRAEPQPCPECDAGPAPQQKCRGRFWETGAEPQLQRALQAAPALLRVLAGVHEERAMTARVQPVQEWAESLVPECAATAAPDGRALCLRVVLDGSSLELFTQDGQALSTRLHHRPQEAGAEGAAGDAAQWVQVFHTGSVAAAADLEAFHVGSIWV